MWKPPSPKCAPRQSNDDTSRRRHQYLGARRDQARMDAVMYCLDALERFAKMTPDEVQKVGFELAILGMSGLDVNDSTPKYRLRSLPGEFSGLHLVAIEYVAFKQIAPEQSLGFDLAREYEMALALNEQRSGKGSAVGDGV